MKDFQKMAVAELDSESARNISGGELFSPIGLNGSFMRFAIKVIQAIVDTVTVENQI